MTWLLDTNVVIQAIRGRPAKVRRRLNRVGPDDVTVSAITVAELWYGAERSAEPQRRKDVFEEFLKPYEDLPFDRPAGEHHGRLRHQLRHNPIGERDLLIAAIAMANDLIVVTSNVREFRRVPGLKVEDWSE
ncbi:MAG: type II toxin-antitoxin system VapC family toxin [Acidimicrobiia bacterium]